MAVAAKGTLVAGVVAAETVAAVALCIMGTFRRGTMEAMNRRVQHYGKRSGIFGMVNIKSGKPSSWVKPADGMQSQCKARKRGGEIKKRENSLLQVQLKEGCQHNRRFPEKKRVRTTENASVVSKKKITCANEVFTKIARYLWTVTCVICFPPVQLQSTSK